jgi:aspartate aminotransferase
MEADPMEYRFARRVTSISPSPTVAVSDRARQLKAAGRDIIDLGGGDPDFPTPMHIVQAAADAMEAGDTHYVASPGIIELRREIVKKLREENGIEYSTDEIVVTPGGKPAVYSSIMTLIDEGDEVLVLDPGWVSYVPEIVLAQGTPVNVPLSPDDNFALSEERIRPYITARTRAVILCSPNNPTGRVASRAELEALANLAREHNLIVFSDEIYEKLIYDGREHISIASLPGMRERTVTLNGFSKAYAMTGWRLGFLAAPAPIVRQMLKLYSHSLTCAASFSQRGAVAALAGPQEVIGQMVEAYDRRRRFVTEGLNAIPGVRCALPEGAFYSFPDIRGTGLSSAECAELLLERGGVAVTPGSAFGTAGEGFIRLSYATSDEELHRAIERMGEVLAAVGTEA